MSQRRILSPLIHVLLYALIPVLALLAGQAIAGVIPTGERLVVCWLFTSAIVFLTSVTRPQRLGVNLWFWPGCLFPILVTLCGASLLPLSDTLDLGAWMLLAGCYVILCAVDEVLTRGTFWLRILVIRLSLAILAGVLPVALSQIEGRFSEEEFFCAVQGVILAGYWLAVRFVVGRLSARPLRLTFKGMHVRRQVVGMVVTWLAFCGGMIFVRGYQGSFYSTAAPEYPGISASTPFLCGSADKSDSVVSGAEVHERLLASVAANPNKGAADYGMLAAGTQDVDWALQFRNELLSEAHQGLFAGPANSVKYQQYLASQRLYYYLVAQRAFPELFSDEDQAVLQEWFADINARALTVEWVDWMYGLAFSKWPEGPYENQESGAALLSLMELGGIGNDRLSSLNSAYLSRAQRGWPARFANTDDAFVYQSEWITNAFLQGLYAGEVPYSNRANSFEWMLLQLLPGGEPLGYNHAAVAPTAGSLYLGAVLLDDPRYVWLSNQALDALSAQGGYAKVQVGAESPVDLTGYAPDQGSCLIYGDSGLPNQVGPLAPDKIVFRDGWDEDDTYLLLDLRFTGWHRYKATNTVSLAYWGRAISQEMLSGSTFEWLPKGRSLFRDKRVPRENLNGVTVERTGVSAVVYTLTGWGGKWAQDPQYYTEVIAFEPGDEFDMAHTRMNDWRGWTQDRWIYLYHDQGPIVVVDEAVGPAHRESVLTWHLPSDATVGEEAIALPDDEYPAALQVLCISGSCSTDFDYEEDSIQASWKSRGSWKSASVFLFGDWVDNSVTFSTDDTLLISGPSGSVRLDVESAASAGETE